MQPSFKVVDERCRRFLSGEFTSVGRLATNAGFYFVERCNPLQSFFGNPRSLRRVDVKEALQRI